MALPSRYWRDPPWPAFRDLPVSVDTTTDRGILTAAPPLLPVRQARNFRGAWLDRATQFIHLVPEGGMGFGWETRDMHPAGALGDASRAQAAGAAVVAPRLAGLLGEGRRFDLDTWVRDAPEQPPHR